MASIFENPNGTFKIRVYCGSDSTGRPIMKTKTYTPSNKNLSYAKLTKEVEEFAAKFEEEVKTLSNTALENPPLSDFVETYLEIKKDSLSPNTYVFYDKVLHELLIPMFGKMKLRDIKTFHVQQFITFLATKKEREDGRKGHLSASTVKRYTTVFKSLLSLAYRMDYIDVDVGLSRKLEYPKQEHKEIQAFDLQEVDDILHSLEEEPIRVKALIETALFTGCRRGEIVGLKWSDIDLIGQCVSIRRSIYKPKGEKAREKDPKTASSYRKISIPLHLCNTLREYKNWQNRHKLFMGDEWNDLDYVFTEEDGNVMHPHTPTKQFDHFLKRHNIRHLKFHGLRHTSATWLLAQGCDLKTVSARLGHADIETTGIYVHAMQEMDRNAADKFDSFFFSNKEDQPFEDSDKKRKLN